MNRFVYLDHNATTKVSAYIKDAVQPYLDLAYGNPSSRYMIGSKIKSKIDDARKNCAELLDCEPENIIFTSGGSESNCAAFNSAINFYPERKKIVTTKVEHTSILEYCKLMENKGYEVVYLDVDKNCNLIVEQLEQVIDENTCLVSIQFANNEVGTILLTNEVLTRIHELKVKHKFVFHVDAVQALGKLKLDIDNIDADLMSFSGHKVHCPKGIGMLYVKNRKEFTPLITGHQEFGLRGGTENVVGIISLGEACKHIRLNLRKILKQLEETRNDLEKKILKYDGLKVNAKNVDRIPNTTSITFNVEEGNATMLKLERYGIFVSTGSACNSESSEPSHVLVSMGIENPGNTIRVSIDESTTTSEIDYFVKILKDKII